MVRAFLALSRDARRAPLAPTVIEILIADRSESVRAEPYEAIEVRIGALVGR